MRDASAILEQEDQRKTLSAEKKHEFEFEFVESASRSVA